jgi:pimeloyl-ACP methyl ester carboxylesterase
MTQSAAAFAERSALLERLLQPLALGAAWVVTHPMRLPSVLTPGSCGLRYRRFSLASGDGTRLAAWFVPREGSDVGIVLCHGHDDCRMQFLPLLRPLHEAGFNLILFDFRSMGLSGGRRCSYGYHERQDALAAVEWMRHEAGMRRLGIMGISMGGATALLAAAADPRIEAVVTDCAFASLEDMVAERFRVVPAPIRDSLGRSVAALAERWCDSRMAEVHPEAAVRSWRPRPYLAIHAGRDMLVPPSHGERLAAAGGELAQLWTVPGAWHARSRVWAGREYHERVSAFFRRHLLSHAEGD